MKMSRLAFLPEQNGVATTCKSEASFASGCILGLQVLDYNPKDGLYRTLAKRREVRADKCSREIVRPLLHKI